MNKPAAILILLLALAAAGAWWFTHRNPSTPPPAIKVVTTQPTTRPTTKPIIPAPLASYIDIVRAQNPAVPATQPLGIPVDLPDAAHIVLHDPIYLDLQGHLWITRTDAKPTAQSLRKPLDPTEHVIPDRPLFVHWWIDADREWSVGLIVKKPGGGLEFVSATDRISLPADRPYHWESAFSWEDKIIVPTDAGISVIEVEPKLQEHYHALPWMTKDSTQPLAVLDARGVLAWAPWDNGRAGSRGAARFVDGKWTDLKTDQWPEKIVQLVPLLDGSILQVVAGTDDQVSLTISPLESTDIDQKHVNDLVEQLADPDDAKRQSAFSELSQYGPGLCPILEKISDDQPAEARVRIQQLLRNKIAPALGGMTLMDNRLQVVRRQNDGVAVLFAPVGVKIPNGDQDPRTLTPAWLCVRRNGTVDRALPPALVSDLRADDCSLRVTREDFLLCDSAGPRRFIGNTFVPLVRADEREFNQLIGYDHRGRWLFTRPTKTTSRPTTSPATEPAVTETLIIDPTILDPTPRLPVWTMKIQNGTAGWDTNDWPVVKRGSPWALKTDSWEALPEKAEMMTDRPPAPSPTTLASTSTQPTTAESLGPPLLVTSDGTKYFDGRTSLVVQQKDGKQTIWPLPPTAVGDIAPTLLRTPDGMLFLYNQSGRLLRIKPTPKEFEPFKLEATFTQDIPNVDHPTRIWLDPAGRINFVYDGNTLSIMFPAGHMPAEISKMILGNGD